MSIQQISKFIPAAIYALAMIAFTGTIATAQEDGARAHVKEKAMAWINNPTLISGIKAQNAQNASLGQADIDAKDQAWRAEVKNGGGAMTSAVLANDSSGYLKKIRDASQGLYTEIFAMDNKGLNVGQSDLTSDYWQGDEAKWQKTYQAGSGAIHVSEVEFDESSQTYQVQVSVAISDPDSGEVIGAITIGMNAEML
ncbi:PDC sensor domain-containing protein [Emcibacter sp.]|uniref:PDC sensor domain-containing protein n=1 Tax=Emcibacter sp. TaxID=1979954 RepID=UPI003A93CBD1